MKSTLARWISGLSVVVAALLAGSSMANAAADPGVVDVVGTTFSNTVKVDLESELGAPAIAVPGQQDIKGWPIRKVLLVAQEQTDNAFILGSLEKDPIVSRSDGLGDISVNRSQVADSSFDKTLPLFFINADGQTAMRDQNGQVSVYTDLNPQVQVSKSIAALKVSISPGGPLKLKAGNAGRFKATVDNPAGTTVTLSWLVNGDSKQTGTSVKAGTFEFEFRDEGTYTVAVFASAPGTAQVADSVTVTVGKAPEKKQEKPKESGGGSDLNTDDSGNYIPGYTDDIGGNESDGAAGGSGTGSPSTGSPPPVNQPKKQEQEQPADDGLDTVSGQLVDPSQIATVVPPAEAPSTGEEEASPAEDPSAGGGISDGALTVMGIGALLGLGGLAEAGAFAGAFRRFRP
ncbi:MAG: hypothetical protein KDB48_04485 [Solirubrobacterales bacterium]|nr:hypothetical protein [Solirubrobacterales bacterium]